MAEKSATESLKATEKENEVLKAKLRKTEDRNRVLEKKLTKTTK